MNPILLLVFGLTLLIFGGEFFVNGASNLAYRLKIPSLIIGLTVVAFGTSAPELAVSMQASLEGNTDISVGNVIGSNIFNILIVLGLSSVISPLMTTTKLVKNDLVAMVLVALLSLILSLDGKLSLVDGLVLLLFAILYFVWLFKFQGESPNDDEIPPEKIKHPLQSIVLILLALGALIFGTNLTIDGAKQIATHLGISERVISLTIIAGGTSLPELVTSMVATYRGQRDIAIGNVIGSNILNILIILSLSAVVAPEYLAVTSQSLRADFPMMIFASVLCIPIFLTGRKISRPEGATFIMIYLGYLAFLFYQ